MAQASVGTQTTELGDVLAGRPAAMHAMLPKVKQAGAAVEDVTPGAQPWTIQAGEHLHDLHLKLPSAELMSQSGAILQTLSGVLCCCAHCSYATVSAS